MRSSERQSRLAFCLLALLALPAHGQQDPAQALARAQALLRQVSLEKQQLEATNARLTAENASLQKRLAGAEGNLKSTQNSLASAAQKAERSGAALDGTRERLTDLEAQLRTTDADLRTARSEIATKERELSAISTRLADVEAQQQETERKNLLLFQANVELLELYEDKGPLDALLQREPTGLKRVGIENVVEEYRLKIDDSLSDGNRKAGDGAAATDGPPPK